MRLALDAMGGDHAPAAAVEGAVRFARSHPSHTVILVGDTAHVRPLLARDGTPPANVLIEHASQVVGFEEDAGAAIRRKKDSSLRVGLELVHRGAADAFVSAGHSGAVLAGTLFILGRLPGVERPAIAALFPALKKGRCVLLDAGANVDCRPSHLAQWAVMGDAYVRAVLAVARPRVALLSNGEEETKGTELTRQAAALLRSSDLRFVGYVEGKDIFSGVVDVVVTDGFTGNVVLKTAEGTAMGIVGMIKEAIDAARLPERLGALLLKPTLLGLKKVVDYAEYGGAPLLGTDGVSIVAHGRSDARAIASALAAALATREHRLTESIRAAIHRSSGWLPTRSVKKGKGTAAESVPD
ncbi:MAG TPA: phosphate acyltransferase PlsX [Myxococcaceae bacterium]|nr:phosphate acyltransferase PlsX [Myxococcaceae bacterium]